MSDDQLWIERLQQGDRQAVLHLYQRYKDDLLTVAACLLADLASAEDCLHDLFVKLASGQIRMIRPSNLKGFLATCVANGARDLLRRTKRSPKLSASEIKDRVAAPTQPVIETLIDREEWARLYAALARLPYEQREAITLHLHGQLTFQQVAQQQRVSLSTAQSRYQYGLEKLRAFLEVGAQS